MIHVGFLADLWLSFYTLIIDGKKWLVIPGNEAEEPSAAVGLACDNWLLHVFDIQDSSYLRFCLRELHLKGAIAK